VALGLCLELEYFVSVKKLKAENPWLAFIPLVNVFLMLKMAGITYWAILLLIIPVVNMIFMIIVWMKISEKLRFSKWLGLLMVLPLVNLIVIFYLAFGTPAVGGPVETNTPAQSI
jgi:hypothetical protein